MSEDTRHGPVHTFLADDHRRLDELLRRAVEDPGTIDPVSFAAFRAGLLRHIAMEEKVLLPEAQRRRGGEALPVAKQLRADHAALAAMLVPPPALELVTAIRTILEPHNELEEGPDGLYATCDTLVGSDAEDLVARLRAVSEVRVAAYRDGPRIREHIARLLRERGSS